MLNRMTELRRLAIVTLVVALMAAGWVYLSTGGRLLDHHKPHEAIKDVGTPPKPRTTMIEFVTVDGNPGDALEVDSVHWDPDMGLFLIDTGMGTMYWKGSILIVDRDKLDALNAKTEAETHGLKPGAGSKPDQQPQ